MKAQEKVGPEVDQAHLEKDDDAVPPATAGKGDAVKVRLMSGCGGCPMSRQSGCPMFGGALGVKRQG